ncbi:hypothetical protein OSH11_21020 [Kaistia dalseonensis]|uniref:Uncharacterized protein n=1 Tax=Kaistia dalseonensis TaxID=410840 RepID=A0ABU0HDB0_9HYPH|nr:hypothetical protein [Kaistia dalseonensis]MCX5497197.1 hypothetical protein [Kaistia dalseonensis]MDQ0439828.1 hypothetical protein [Kaistia dalseonensis]
MSSTNIVAIIGIVAAFTAFMITLAWAERQTRTLPQRITTKK